MIGPHRWFFLALPMLLTAIGAGAQDDLPYQLPPESIVKIVDAPWTPKVELSPDRRAMLLMEYPGLPDIEEVAQPELRLAGMRLNPRTNGPSREWRHDYLKIRSLDSAADYQVDGLPARPWISEALWSPDGRYIAFAHTAQDQVQLWLVSVADRTARQLCEQPLNAAFENSFRWLSDSRTLIVRLIPSGRPEPPRASLAPSGPNVQENLGGKAPARTYQDLLHSPADERLFEHYAVSQLAFVSVDGSVTPIGSPAIYTRAVPSPDGRLLLVETIHRPYSYTVPAENFPRLIEVWNRSGDPVRRLADLPLADNVPITFGSVPTGPREVDWRADADASLYWVEALDGGDAGTASEERDRLFLFPEPFRGDPIPLLTLDVRLSGIHWSSDDLALVTGRWWKTRQIRVWRIRPGSPEIPPVLLQARSSEDRYGDPGAPLMQPSGRGTSVLLTAGDGATLFLTGDGASPEGNRPFLDEYNVDTGAKTRLFRSEAPYFEQAVALLDLNKRLLLTRRESVDEPPNYFRRDLAHNDLKQLTFFPHPTPELADVKKELIRYTRADGLELTGTLYLPPTYDPRTDGPLPMLMWAYPQEYKSAKAAGQVRESPYRFIRVSWSSPLVWLAEGYAVLDDPSMPIVGEGDSEPNDSYVDQLVADARAAVDEMIRRGIAAPGKIAIGGHSYGAFMTANLLAHSDLFAAGIARSGAYNRTLTPFGFQSEERTFWDAPDVYFEMSPFMHAPKINEPLLLLHGEADNNSGTFPMQSERFYAALKGQGATARLVILPHESHGYRARQSVMHVLWEMHRWMEAYIKNPPQAEPGTVKSMTGQG